VFGHLEYGTDALLREYAGNLACFLEGLTRDYPLLPAGDLDLHEEEALTALQSGSSAAGNAQLRLKVAFIVESAPITNTWQHSATMIDKNWLNKICARKNARRPHSGPFESLAVSR
jgi:hypothetical protein